jgi:hypothetical protein
VWVLLCLIIYASARQSAMQARVKLPETVLTALTFQPAKYAYGTKTVGNERRISSPGINHMAARILPGSTQRNTIDYG